MKPLACYTYIKNNKRKILPSLICTIISVVLVYLFGLLLYGSIDDFNKVSVNAVKNGTFLYTNNNDKPINENILRKIEHDSNVSEILPMLGLNDSFNCRAAFGNMRTNSYIFYSQDVKQLLKKLRLELVAGRIPRDNKNELLLPLELVKQYGLKLGDYIDNKSNEDITVTKTYQLVGITKGDTWMPIVCDVGVTKRQIALKRGIMFFFKDINNKTLNDRIVALNDKAVVIQEYKSMKVDMKQITSSIDFLYLSINIMILLVLCLSLGNLNYIIFLNRKNEFAIFITIGISKAKLRTKLFMENALICLVGFFIGVGLTTLITMLLNIVIWNPDGKNIPIFRLSALLVALLIPIAVSILGMISSVREFNKLNYESLSI